MTEDLRGRMERMALNIRQDHLDALARLGVTAAALARVGFSQPPIGVFDGHPAFDGLYVEGKRSYAVQPVISRGYVIDLVCWRTTSPDRWTLSTGLGWCMNEDALSMPPEHPIVVHSRPVDWLASGGEGICILDWDAPELRMLQGYPEFVVISPELGDLLKRKIARTLPRIIVRKGLEYGKAA